MTHLPLRNRARMMAGCGSAALALALVLTPGQAAAQGILADGQVVSGEAGIFLLASPTNGATIIQANSPTVVIDWTPALDQNGNPLEFLPAGNEAIFLNGADVFDFAVLNRILPTPGGSPVAINGIVTARIEQVSARGTPLSPFVAFYSPTGFLIGSTASFDVGQLMLTTLDTTPENFESFVAGGTLNLAAQGGSTASIRIASGAQITAPAENGFFAVVAAEVQMSGTALVNGSQAYVVGEQVNLRLTNGLFDIEVPVGTAAGGTVLQLDGTIGGPASTGALTDNHVIYGVAAAQNDPITMLLRGNLGFEPAQQVGVVNGEIILAANFDVLQRTVNSGSSEQGIGATFGTGFGNGGARADILIENVTATSGMMAVGTHLTRLSAVGGNSTVGGNLLLAGREAAEALVGAGDTLSITGDLLVSADAIGGLDDTPREGDVSVVGGAALVEALAGASLLVDGSVRVSADAAAEIDTLAETAGTARGGDARLLADGALVDIGGSAAISARGLGALLFGAASEGAMRGGTAELRASNAADVAIGADLTVTAEAFSRLSTAGAAGSTIGGEALFTNAGSTIDVTGLAIVDASASAAGSESPLVGALADAGEARVLVEGGGLTTIGGQLSLSADAGGGFNFDGRGGDALGGVALAVTRGGGTLEVTGEFSANAEADGGFGVGGGNGFGGVAGAVAETGTIDLQSSASAIARGSGGSAFIGVGERGGDGTGGTALFRAEGTLSQAASLTVGIGINATADGTGGEGGRTDGTIRGGRGGDGRGGSALVPNQADSGFVGGAYILAGGDNGTLTTGALSNAAARGIGGDGGDYATIDDDQGPEDAGDGGNGFGGTAQVGTALLGGGNGSLGEGRAQFAGIVVNVEGSGGAGGRDEGDGFVFGTGTGLAGNGTGGSALLTAGGGRVITSSLDLRAPGLGGLSQNGGTGQGGTAAIRGEAGGTVTAGTTFVDAPGFGGFGDGGAGGAGIGGEAAILLDGITATFSSLTVLNATGFGGFATAGDGGAGSGGTAFIGQRIGTLGGGTFTDLAIVEANGNGGGGGSGPTATGGAGTGGTAGVAALGGSTLRFGALSVGASGEGGSSESFSSLNRGGDGAGGTATIASRGSGSQVIVETNSLGQFVEGLGGGAILAAIGRGGDTSGGNGIGGRGTGGTILLSAAQGGAITLPANPLADQNSPGAIGLLAYGIGGGSRVDGGAGGIGVGGSGTIEADSGGTIATGVTEFSVYGEGGSSLESALAVGGGRGEGGARLIRVAGSGSSLTGEFAEGRAGGFGGDASGGRSGGNAATGTSTIDIDGGTLNIVGNLLWVDSSTGGDGAVGGDVSARGGDVAEVAFIADNATITFSPNPEGESGLVVGVRLTGGNGSAAGGNVSDGLSVIDLNASSLTFGNIRLENLALGGSASDQGGTGGNAEASRADFVVTDSTVGLARTNVIASTAQGGASVLGSGGDAVDTIGTGGTVNVALANSEVTIVSGVGVAGSLAVVSRAIGGEGNVTGDAFARAATLGLEGGSLSVGFLSVGSFGSASAAFSGQTGGAAGSDVAAITIDGPALLAATLIDIAADATSSLGGTSAAGEALFAVTAGSQAQVFSPSLTLSATATGGATNTAGRFALTAAGGELAIGQITAAAQGDSLPANAPASQIAATGGAVIGVSGLLNASALGDIAVDTSLGGTIGNTAATGNTTTVVIDTDGSLRLQGGSTAGTGLGGQSVTLLAGRSILLGGSVAARGGSVSLEANRGGLPLAQPAPIVITMGQGSRIDAGTGTAAISLLDGGGDPQRATGAITLASITGSAIDVRNFGSSAGSDIQVRADGVLSASGTGRAIDLASLGGEVINLAGDAGLVLTGGGHYGIFAESPGGSQIGSFANYLRRYNVPDAEGYDQIDLGGNFAAFRIAPVITVSADDAARLYGDANPDFAAIFDGFEPGDGVADLSGAPLFFTEATGLSGIGQYAIDIELGTLLSEQGYQFAIGSPGVLTVTPRPITVTADNLSKLLGLSDPALTFAVSGAGLVNGDQLSGSLARDPGELAGAYAIRQGTLAAGANYTVTYVPGTFAIEPGPIPPGLDNPTSFEDPIIPDEPPPAPAEEDDAFGMDFPEQPDAPLITGDDLLDDPVASGNDALLYATPGDEEDDGEEP